MHGTLTDFLRDNLELQGKKKRKGLDFLYLTELKLCFFRNFWGDFKLSIQGEIEIYNVNGNRALS